MNRYGHRTHQSTIWSELRFERRCIPSLKCHRSCSHGNILRDPARQFQQRSLARSQFHSVCLNPSNLDGWSKQDSFRTLKCTLRMTKPFAGVNSTLWILDECQRLLFASDSLWELCILHPSPRGWQKREKWLVCPALVGLDLPFQNILTRQISIVFSWRVTTQFWRTNGFFSLFERRNALQKTERPKWTSLKSYWVPREFRKLPPRVMEPLFCFMWYLRDHFWANWSVCHQFSSRIWDGMLVWPKNRCAPHVFQVTSSK
jgi:hypothetical protein